MLMFFVFLNQQMRRVKTQLYDTLEIIKRTRSHTHEKTTTRLCIHPEGMYQNGLQYMDRKVRFHGYLKLLHRNTSEKHSKARR